MISLTVKFENVKNIRDIFDSGELIIKAYEDMKDLPKPAQKMVDKNDYNITMFILSEPNTFKIFYNHYPYEPLV